MLSKEQRASIKAYLDVYVPRDKLYADKSASIEITENLNEFVKYNEVLSFIKEHYRLSYDKFSTIDQHEAFIKSNMDGLEKVIGKLGFETLNMVWRRIYADKKNIKKSSNDMYIVDDLFWQGKALFDYYRKDHPVWKKLSRTGNNDELEDIIANMDGDVKFEDIPTFDEKIPALGVSLIELYPYANIIGRDDTVEKAHEIVTDFANQIYKEQKKRLDPFFEIGSEQKEYKKLLKSIKKFCWFDILGKPLPDMNVERFYSPVMIIDGPYGTGKTEFFVDVDKDLDYILNENNFIGLDIEVGRKGNSPVLELLPAGYARKRERKHQLVNSVRKFFSLTAAGGFMGYLFSMIAGVNDMIVRDYENRPEELPSIWKTETVKGILTERLVQDLIENVVQLSVLGGFFLAYGYLRRKYDRTPKLMAEYAIRDITLPGVPDVGTLLGEPSSNSDYPQGISISAIAEAHMKTLKIPNLEYYPPEIQAMLGEISEGGKTNLAGRSELHFTPRFIICASTNDKERIEGSLEDRAKTGLRETFEELVPFQKGVTDNHLMMLIKYWSYTNGWAKWDVNDLRNYISKFVKNNGEEIEISRHIRGAVARANNYARRRASIVTRNVLEYAEEEMRQEAEY